MAVTKAHLEATTDFETFYLAWEPKVQTAVRQAGFHGIDGDDLVQDIFTHLHQGGYLAKFDPEATFNGKKTNFNTYIWGNIKVRILDRKRSLFTASQHEFVAEPVEVVKDDDTMRDSGLINAELEAALESVYADLQHLPATESKDLARLFSDIVEAVRTEGKFSQADLAKKRGVSRQAISYQIRDLAKTKAAVHLYDILTLS